KRERLRRVLALVGKAGDDGFGFSGRHQGTATHAEAHELGIRADVQVITAPLDACAGQPRSEALLLFEAPIAVVIAERDDGAWRLTLFDRAQRDIYIPARTHAHVPGGTEVIGHHGGAKGRWQGDPTVTGIAWRFLRYLR